MLVWKPRLISRPIKWFFEGLFVGKGVKASGVLTARKNPLKQPPVFNERPERDFIYVIRDGGNVKIGIATDPYARVRALQTGAANPLELCFAAPVSGSALAVEQRAHELLASSRVRLNGEWFAVTPQTAIAAIQDAAALVGAPLFKGG